MFSVGECLGVPLLSPCLLWYSNKTIVNHVAESIFVLVNILDVVRVLVEHTHCSRALLYIAMALMLDPIANHRILRSLTHLYSFCDEVRWCCGFPGWDVHWCVDIDWYAFSLHTNIVYISIYPSVFVVNIMCKRAVLGQIHIVGQFKVIAFDCIDEQVILGNSPMPLWKMIRHDKSVIFMPYYL